MIIILSCILLMHINKQESEKIWFFLFINSKSGGQIGKEYLTVDRHKIIYQYGKDTTVYLHLVDLFDQRERDTALRRIRNAQVKISKRGKGRVNGVICGGDGTVMWVISLISQYGIDLNKISFCTIPIGTGNDFSRCLGWGGSAIYFSKGKLSQLRSRLFQWLQADESFYDIWHVGVKVDEDGQIVQIRDKKQVSTRVCQVNRGFVNYFGIGVDARVTYKVQIYRNKNKAVNLVLYACIGIIKFFQKIRSISQAINSFEENSKQQQCVNALENNQLPQESQKYMNKIQLKAGFGGLVALNSINYMAGIKNVWETDKLGIITQTPPSFQEQRFDDGKIEFIGFKNELSLGLQSIGNFGARVAQGQGPYNLKFKRTEDNSWTYIQIDGQPYKVRQLKEITIKKHFAVPSGKIKVLIKKGQMY